MDKTRKEDYLVLKWGTLKEWNFHSKKAKSLLKEYSKIGFASGGRMMQEDTPRQKEIICELIDEGNFDYVFNDWTSRKMNKERAKRYVLNYGNKFKKKALTSQEKEKL